VTELTRFIWAETNKQQLNTIMADSLGSGLWVM